VHALPVASDVFEPDDSRNEMRVSDVGLGSAYLAEIGSFTRSGGSGER